MQSYSLGCWQMTLEEAEKILLNQKALLATQNMGRNDLEIMLMLVQEVIAIREFLYQRMGELP